MTFLRLRWKRHLVVGCALGVSTSLALILSGAVRNATVGPPSISQPQLIFELADQGSIEGRSAFFSIPDFEAVRTGARTVQAVAAIAPVIVPVSTEALTAEDVPVSLVSDGALTLLTGRTLTIQPGAALVSASWFAHAAREDATRPASVFVGGRKYAIAAVVSDSLTTEALGTAVWIGLRDAPQLYGPAVLSGGNYFVATVLVRLTPGRSVRDAADEISEIVRARRGPYRTPPRLLLRSLLDVLVPQRARTMLTVAMIVSLVSMAISVLSMIGLAALWATDETNRFKTMRLLGAHQRALMMSLAGPATVTAIGSVAGAWGGVLLATSLIRSFLAAGTVHWLAWATTVSRAIDAILAASIISFVGVSLSRSMVLGRLGGRWTALPVKATRSRAILSAAQLALAVLLVSMLISQVALLSDLQRADLGFNPDRLFFVRARYAGQGPIASSVLADVAGTLSRIAGREVAVSTSAPLFQPGRDVAWQIQWFTEGPTVPRFHPSLSYVSSSYFAVAGTRVSWLGEDSRDNWARGRGAVVSEVVKQRTSSPNRLFLNVDESGRRLDGGVPVAGYVSSLFNAGPRQPATSDVFLSIDAASVRAVYYVVRGNRSTVDAIARSLLAMTPTLEASPQVISIEDRIRSTQSNERLSIALISPTAATCLIGILCGVFANITSLIASRRREIAIREALGSPFSRLAREVVGGELAAASAGMFVGIILTVFASQVMLNQGWSVQPSPSMIAVTLFLLTSATGVAVVAALRRLPRGSAAMLARWGVD